VSGEAAPHAAAAIGGNSVSHTHPTQEAALKREMSTVLATLRKRLYALLSKTTRYRNILRGKIKRLRAGSAPEEVRALLAQWKPTLREIKRLAQGL